MKAHLLKRGEPIIGRDALQKILQNHKKIAPLALHEEKGYDVQGGSINLGMIDEEPEAIVSMLNQGL